MTPAELRQTIKQLAEAETLVTECLVDLMPVDGTFDDVPLLDDARENILAMIEELTAKVANMEGK